MLEKSVPRAMLDKTWFQCSGN